MLIHVRYRVVRPGNRCTSGSETPPRYDRQVLAHLWRMLRTGERAIGLEILGVPERELSDYTLELSATILLAICLSQLLSIRFKPH